jgi:hypothetical protein
MALDQDAALFISGPRHKGCSMRDPCFAHHRYDPNSVQKSGVIGSKARYQLERFVLVKTIVHSRLLNEAVGGLKLAHNIAKC